MAQNGHGQREPLHVEHFAQPPTGKRSAVRSPILGQPTQLLESRRAFGPEGPHAEPRVERLLRGRVAAEPVEALDLSSKNLGVASAIVIASLIRDNGSVTKVR